MHWICKTCGKDFETSVQDGKKERKYCSRACYFVTRVGKPRFDLQRRVIKKCLVCGVDFETGGRIGNKEQVFCSRQCQHRARFRHGAESSLLNIANAAYLAGLVDGEGSIMLLGRDSRMIRLTVANTKREVLDWLVSLTGVGAVICKFSANVNHSDSFMYEANSSAAISIIRQIRPYLHIKQEQADLALEVMERLKVRALKADHSWYDEYRMRMKELNRRGAVHGT